MKAQLSTRERRPPSRTLRARRTRALRRRCARAFAALAPCRKRRADWRPRKTALKTTTTMMMMMKTTAMKLTMTKVTEMKLKTKGLRMLPTLIQTHALCLSSPVCRSSRALCLRRPRVACCPRPQLVFRRPHVCPTFFPRRLRALRRSL